MLHTFALLLTLTLLAAAPVGAGIGHPPPDHAQCQYWGDLALDVATLRDRGVEITRPLSLFKRSGDPDENARNMIQVIYARPELSPMAAKDLVKTSCYAHKPF